MRKQCASRVVPPRNDGGVWFVLRQAQDDRMVGGICELDVFRKQ